MSLVHSDVKNQMAEESNNPISLDQGAAALLADLPDDTAPDLSDDSTPATDLESDDEGQPELDSPNLEDDDDTAESSDDEADEDDETPSGPAEIDLETEYNLDGETVTGDELRKGYLRQKDYFKKTQSLSEQRRENAKHGEGINEMLPELSMLHKAYEPAQQMAAQLRQAFNQFTPDQQKVVAHVVNLIEGIQNQVNQGTQKLVAGRKKAGEGLRSESISKLKMEVPGWGPDRYKAVRQHAVDEYGYTAEQIDKLENWQLLLPIERSLKLNELQSQASKAKPAPSKKGNGKLPLKPAKERPRTSRKLASLDKTRKEASGKHDQLMSAVDFLAAEQQSNTRRRK